MDFKNEVKRIVKELRMEKLHQAVERVKYNAFADDGSSYSARKLNLYNIRVKEMV